MLYLSISIKTTERKKGHEINIFTEQDQIIKNENSTYSVKALDLFSTSFKN